MKTKLTVLSFLILLFLIQCGNDNGIESKQGAIKGKITFTGQWPETPTEVRLFTAMQFPLSNKNDMILGETIPNDVSSYDYTLSLDPGVYEIVGIAWKANASDWDFSNICGIYYSGVDSLNPGEVVLNTDTSIVSGIDIVVNRSKARVVTGAKITGTVDFEGAWPDSFMSAIVFASTKDLLTESFSLLDLSVSGRIPSATSTYNYEIIAPPADYQTIGVLFLEDDLTISSNRLYYSQNVGGINTEQITVSGSETVNGPNFYLQIGPVISAIEGAIRFSGSWPATAEEVRLITATTFPPNFEDLIIGDLIPPDAEIHEYSFKLRANTYKLVGVAWRAENTDWDILSICGFYFSGNDSLAPGEVIIPTDTSIVENINIEVNRSKARKITDTKITGSIQFNGAWPEDITEARVIATTKFKLGYPVELPTLLDLAFSDVIPVGIQSTDYIVKAFPAEFVATGVIFFKADQTLSIDDILYSSQIGALDFTVYEAPEDETVEGPDFNVQF